MLEVEKGNFFDEITELHALITTRTHEFSNESIHIPGKEVKTEYSGRDKLENKYGLKIFANGWQETNKGYVSVTFYPMYADLLCLGRCSISLIDASGNKRFSTTCIFNDMKNKEDKYIQYISRKTLLGDPDEYLSNDVLTLHIDVHFYRSKHTIREIVIENKRLTAGNEKKFKRGRREVFRCFTCTLEPSSARETFRLHLDSPLAKFLADESSFFRDNVNTPMTEQNTKTMIVERDEYMALKNIGDIVMEKTAVEFSIKEIFDMYILADKYNIPYVIEICTGFLKLCLCRYSVDDYLEIANKYETGGLREIIVKAISLISMTDLKEETGNTPYVVYLKQPIRKCIWMYCKEMQSFSHLKIIQEEEINSSVATELMFENE